MNPTMFRRALRALRGQTLGYSIGLALYGLLACSNFANVRANGAAITRLIATYPPALRRALGLTTITTLPGYVGARYLNMMWPLIAGIFFVLAGSAAVAQEVERGTSELWLSVPVSRARLLGSKLAALGVAVAVVSAASVLALVVAARGAGESFGAGPLAATFATLAAYGVAVTGFAALCSAGARSRGRAAAIASTVLLGSYVALIASGSSERAGWLRHVSFFSAFAPQRALETGSVAVGGLAALLAIGVASGAGALVVFGRRDAVG